MDASILRDTVLLLSFQNNGFSKMSDARFDYIADYRCRISMLLKQLRLFACGRLPGWQQVVSDIEFQIQEEHRLAKLVAKSAII
jgi:hypothetical protein